MTCVKKVVTKRKATSCTQEEKKAEPLFWARPEVEEVELAI
jgi:hypothetical protein